MSSEDKVQGSKRKIDEYIGKYIEKEEEQSKQAKPTAADQNMGCEGLPA
jgi:hypothetical protein